MSLWLVFDQFSGCSGARVLTFWFAGARFEMLRWFLVCVHRMAPAEPTNQSTGTRAREHPSNLRTALVDESHRDANRGIDSNVVKCEPVEDVPASDRVGSNCHWLTAEMAAAAESASTGCSATRPFMKPLVSFTSVSLCLCVSACRAVALKAKSGGSCR